MSGPIEAPLSVVATAGHVDHGKSSLILRLTGTDPDRLAEEKRRGLTIDLGFAWTTLASGRELGFVDVPGHERFVRNMLAGVGPVRLVLFVVAADEGWKPQSEEHLAIIDVLGVDGAVVALTKVDLVDAETLAAREAEVRERIAGTALAAAPILPCSSATGAGLDELRAALDAMLAGAPAPESDGRPRQFVDRVFTIRGAGTVVTGTLTGGPLAVGQEAEVLPSGHRARIRGLQTHKRPLEAARPVSRVAVNLAGTPTEALGRGDVLSLPDSWHATRTFEGWLRPVRGLAHAVTERGAFKLYAGAAERDARIRFLDARELRPGDERAYARVALAEPVVLDVGDRFVLREAGRRETVAGGQVLDVDPPARPGRDALTRLRAREGASRGELARLLVDERGAVRPRDLEALTGAPAAAALERGAVRLPGWVASPALVERASALVAERLTAEHAAHPLRRGLDVGEARAFLAGAALARGSGAGGSGAGGSGVDASGPLSVLRDPGLADEVLGELVSRGALARTGSDLHLPGHRPSTRGRDDADRLVAAIAGAEPSPPTTRELAERGFGPELVRAAVADGRLVRVSAELVFTPELLLRAEAVVRELAGRPEGLTVSAFREALGTSRKYALPILEWFDATGVTLRDGDVRRLRG